MPRAAVITRIAGFPAKSPALGRTEDALGHLRRAVEVMPKVGDYARDDERLAALRGNAAFSHITGGG